MVVDSPSLKTLIRHGSAYSAVTALQSVSGLILLPLLTRAMGPNEYGSAALAVTLAQFLHILASAGLALPVTRNFFRGGLGPAAAVRLVRTGCAIAMATSLLMFPLVLTLHYSDLMLTGLAPADLAVSVLAVFPIACLILNQAILRVEHGLLPFAVSGLISSVGAQTLGLLACLASGGDSLAYLLGFAGTQYLAAFVAARGVRARPHESGSDLRNALRISLPTLPHSMALFGLGLGARVLVEASLGIAMAGRYQVLYVVGMLPVAFLGAINNAWAPLVIGTQVDRRLDLVRKTAPVVALVAAFLTIGLAVFSPLALSLAAPSSYELAQSHSLLGIIGIAGLGNVIYITYSQRLFASGITAGMSFITPLVLALSLGIGVFAIDQAELNGAALIPPVAYLSLGFGVAIYARRKIGPTPLPCSFFLPIAIAIATVLLTSLTPSNAWLWRGLEFFCATLALAACFELARRDSRPRQQLEECGA